jgi:hypothetical protein
MRSGRVGKPVGRDGQGWPWVYRNLLSVSETLDWIRTHGEIIVRTFVEPPERVEDELLGSQELSSSDGVETQRQ